MRFVAMRVQNDGSFADRIAGLRQWKLRDAIGLSEVEMAAKFFGSEASAIRFDATTVEHLLRHRSGWDPYFDWGGKANALADHVPLDAGDATPVLRLQTDNLYVADPGAVYEYDNPAFWVLSEIISLAETNGADASLYRPLMRQFWQHAADENLSASVVIPFERDTGFVRGLIPMITSFPGASALPVPGDSENAASYPWRPRTWAEAHGFHLGGGHWAMSMQNLARIYEGMAPNPGPLVPKLLETWQAEVLVGRPFASMSSVSQFGMGMTAARYTAPYLDGGVGSAIYHLIALGGGVWAGSSVAGQYRLHSGAGPATITIAISASTDVRGPDRPELDAILNIVRTINHYGYWDNAPDLFA